MLYVADYVAGKTYAYDINPDGALTNKRLFCSLGSDEMTIDGEGNLYTGEVFNGRAQKFRPKKGADPAKLIGQPYVPS